MLIGLGFRPLPAAGLALIGNTAPVAYGRARYTDTHAGSSDRVAADGAQSDGWSATALVQFAGAVLVGLLHGRLQEYVESLARLFHRRWHVWSGAVRSQQLAWTMVGRYRGLGGLHRGASVFA